MSTYSTTSRLQGCVTRRMDLLNNDSMVAVVQEFKPEIVIHTAGVRGLKDTELSHRINIGGLVSFLDVLDAQLGEGGYNFTYISTDLVYAHSDGVISEHDAELNPIGTYATEKVEAEELLQTRRQRTSLNLAIVRGPFIYGWNLYHDTSYNNNFFIQMVTKLSAGESPTLFDDEFRTPVYIEDASHIIVGAALKFAREPHAEGSRVFNLTSGEVITRYEFGLEICKAFGFDCKLVDRKTLHDGNPEMAELAKRRPQRIHLSDEIVRTELGLKPHGVQGALKILAHENQKHERNTDGYFHVSSPALPPKRQKTVNETKGIAMQEITI